MGKFDTSIITINEAFSPLIQESGKNTGGKSLFVCPENAVVLGRWHEGDENGNTQYKYANLFLGPSIVYYYNNNAIISGGIQESGKISGGTSSFICPDNTVIVGRRHEGDENGFTYYLYVSLVFDDEMIITKNHQWSSWMQESGKDSGGFSIFTCPANTVITGREHKGDENGETRYRYSELYFLNREDEVKLLTMNSVTTDDIKESSGIWSTANENMIMTGRWHQGDENGETRYIYSCVYYNLESPVITKNHQWSNWMQESGKDSGGASNFTCPTNTVITGREHEGDENGNTRYRYSEIYINNLLCKVYHSEWSDESIESSGTWFIAPGFEVMTGRWHQGDENGETKCLFSSTEIFNLTELADNNCNHIEQDINGEVVRPSYSVGFYPWLGDWKTYYYKGGPIFRYYNPSEIDGVGILIGRVGNKLYGENLKKKICEEIPLYAKEEGHYSWVLTPNNNILYKWNSKLEIDQRNYTRHSDLNSGQPVTCAGEFYLKKGIDFIDLDELYIELNDSSGHYKPHGKKCFSFVLDAMIKIGINITNVKVYTRD